MTRIETVTGPIDPGQLGFTLSHEHVLISSAGIFQGYPFLFDMAKTRDQIVRELSEAKAGGVDSIIDLTTLDLGLDVQFVADVSRKSGVQIVVATGLWLDVPRFFWERGPDFLAKVFVHEIREGIAGTDIKAGVIKVANDIGGVTEQGELVLRAAARACRATGVPISTHQWAPEQVGRRQVEIFQEESVDMTRVCIGHSADTTDIEYLVELLETGVYLCLDRYPGREGRPDWRTRNATVKALIDRGFADRLMLGHDYAPAPVLPGQEPETASGPTRYLFLSRTAIPALIEAGVSADTIRTIMVDVPRRFLSGDT
ncbi:MAG: phosphotriesterase family protein [Dehalococcoidia bacterium]